MAATVVPSVIVNLQVLSQDNYEDWSFRVKTYLLAEELWDVVEVTTEPPKLEKREAKFKAWSKDNAKALHTIHISCGDNAYSFIKGISRATVAWDILAEKFRPTEVSHNADVGSDLHSSQTPADGDVVLKKDMEIEAVEGVGSDLHMNQTLLDGDVGPKKDMKIEIFEGGESESMNGNSIYEAFFENVNDWNWDAVMEFIKIHPEAVRAKHPSDGKTALHNAVDDEEVDIVKELVQLMTMEDLEMKDNEGDTVLACAIKGKETDKMIEIVKCLIEKNKKLLTIVDSNGMTALHNAVDDEEVDIVKELVQLMTMEELEMKDNDGDTALACAVKIKDKDKMIEIVKCLVEKNKKLLTIVDSDGRTVLHYAVDHEEVDTVKELVQLMTMEELEMKDKDGCTALACAVLGDDIDKMVDIVKCMVEKNKKILTIVDSDDDIPLLSAFMLQRWKMATYIYSVTPLETLSDREASKLISTGFYLKFLDISLDLIRHNPSLGITDNDGSGPPLLVLANTCSVFLSGSRLKFWEQWIYDCIQVEPTRTMNFKKEPTTTINDICKDVQTQDRCQGNKRHLICSEPTPTKDIKKELTTNINDICIDVQTLERCQGNQRHLNICSGTCNAVGQFFRGLVVTNLLKLVGINRIYQMKLIHVQALEILHRMCEVLKTKDVKDMQDDIVPAIFRAAQLGQVEFMTHICKANPLFKYITDVHGRSLFQFAAECRQEKIFSLTYGLNEQEQKHLVGIRVDNSGNNMLHSIGRLSSLTQIDHIQGAALQMQRELQWFKEVGNIMRPHDRESINADYITPRELFTMNHRELLKEGEKSMKETATSCTVVGALIVTMMFAAAFTVPGGNDGDTGFPIFLDQKAFKFFVASDAISLFFSTTSVMIFLGMLTSRYAQDDFLKSLPRKMILGLSTLFVSIAAMMISFSSAMLLMLPSESWIAYPAILLSTVPITSFVWMQFPLLVEIFISTYGAGPFDRKVQPWDTKQKCSTRKSNLVTKICSSFLCRKVKQNSG